MKCVLHEKLWERISVTCNALTIETLLLIKIIWKYNWAWRTIAHSSNWSEWKWKNSITPIWQQTRHVCSITPISIINHHHHLTYIQHLLPAVGVSTQEWGVLRQTSGVHTHMKGAKLWANFLEHACYVVMVTQVAANHSEAALAALSHLTWQCLKGLNSSVKCSYIVIIKFNVYCFLSSNGTNTRYNN